jgi:hypothetical protein
MIGRRVHPKLPQTAMLLICILEMLSSNPGQNTGYSEIMVVTSARDGIFNGARTSLFLILASSS